MGSIQVRLNQHQFQRRVSEFLDKEINIVFTNNTTSLGNLEEIGVSSIIIRNKRLGKTTHLMTDIIEVYFDKKS